jgi:periplasmic protein TonB
VQIPLQILKFKCRSADELSIKSRREFGHRQDWRKRMSRNEFQDNKSNVPDEDYEKTVLNFLNREIAQTQSESDSPKNQSNEVDTLVSSLLKQVISESDSQQKISQAYPENLDSMLSEFPDAKDAKKDGRPQDEKYAAATASESVSRPPAEIFASGTAQPAKKTMPFKAIALIIALGVIGAAIYFVAGFKHGSPRNAGTPAPISNPATVSGQNEKQIVPPAMAPPAPVSAAKQEPAPNPAPAAITPASASTAKAETKESAKPSAAAENTASNAVPAPPKKETVNPPDMQAAFAASSALQFAPVPSTSNTMVISALENASTVKVVVPAPPPPEPPATSAASSKADPVVSKDVVPATLISHVDPRYPPIALRTKQSATVVLELQIDNTGKVMKAMPVSGPNVFYDEAVRAALRWRYKPASINGTNVPSKSSVTMQFRLQ